MKQEKVNNKKKRIGIVLFALLIICGVFYYSIYNTKAKNTMADEVGYSPINSGLTATNVQDALDQLTDYIGASEETSSSTTDHSGPICKRALQEYLLPDGRSAGKLGQVGTAGTLASGDVFICDVNGDEIFDNMNELFYYVSDYFDTSSKTLNDQYAALISSKYYGPKKFHTVVPVSGPTEAITALPTTETWSNVSLYKEKRAILGEYRTTHNASSHNTAILPDNFSYSGKAARLLTAQELMNACGLTEIGNYSSSEFRDCKYLSGPITSPGQQAQGYWLETFASIPDMYKDYIVQGSYVGSGLYGYVTDKNNSDSYYVRPVIDVKKVDIDLSLQTGYTITYNKNADDATGSMNNQVTYGTIELNYNSFNRTGYTFTGWNTAPDGTGISYDNGSTVNITSDTTLYAQWEQIVIGNLTVNVKKMDSIIPYICSDESESCHNWVDSGINVALYQNNSEVYGYDSSTLSDSTISWSNINIGTYRLYASKDEYNKTTLVDTGIDVTIRPGANTDAEIEYDILSIINMSNVPLNVEGGLYLKGYTIPLEIGTLQEGEMFNNWLSQVGNIPKNSSSPSTTLTITEPTEIEVRVSMITYSLKYDPNGADVLSYINDIDHIAYTEEFEIENNLSVKEGYVFVCWNTAPDGSGTSYSEGQTVSRLTNVNGATVTLYAIWQEETSNSYTVTYDYVTNGGTSTTKTTDTVQSGQEIDLTPLSEKTGYEFLGWNTNQNAHTGLTSINMGSENVTLYAIYKKNIKVTFNKNGATSLSNNSLSCDIYNIDSSCNITGVSPTITRNGYEIVGFNTDQNAIVSTWNQDTPNTISISNDTNYYAITKKNISVKFNANGNTINRNCYEGSTACEETTGNGYYVNSCTIKNLETECSIVAPSIVGSTNTPNVLGFKKQPSSEEGNTIISNQTITINSSGYDEANEWYALTKSNSSTYSVTYTKGANVSEIGKTEDSCTTTITYNGEAPSNTCKVTMPSITKENDDDIAYWTDEVASYNVNELVTISGNKTFTTAVTLKTYTVSFNTDGGTTVQDQIVNRNGKVTKPGNPTKLGYTFDDWYTDSTYSTKYNFDSGVTHNMTIYGKFNQDSHTNTYIVSFETAGGTSIDAQIVEKGHKVIRPSDPTKVGYTFGGWFTDYMFENEYNFNSNVNDNFVLYAKWYNNSNEYIVSFETNGGSSVSSQIVKEGNTVNVPLNPTRDGYEFAGWYKDSSLTTAYNFNTKITKNTIIYAKWNSNSSQNKTYTVSFNTNGGSSVPSQIVEKGSKATRPVDPFKSGYTFAGWYKDSNLDTEFSFNTVINNNIVVYAKWTKIDSSVITKYRVSFETSGGSIINDQIINEGSTVTKPSNPTKQGYTFDDWYTDITLTTKYNFNTIVKSNITIYAKWTKNNDPVTNTYSVTFNTNGGSTISTQYVTEGSTAKVPSNPTKTGYTFGGWYSNSSLTTMFSFNTKIYSDITVYAKWNINNNSGGNSGSNSGSNSGNNSGNSSNNNSNNSSGNNTNSSSNNNSNGSTNSNIDANINDNQTGTSTVTSDGNSTIIDNKDNTSTITDNSGSGSSLVINNETIKNKKIRNYKYKTVPYNDLEKIKKLFPDSEDVVAFDTNVYDENGNIVDLSDELITYKIVLPSGISPTDNIKLYKIVGDSYEEIAFTIKNGYIIFTTKGTGRFSIVKYPKKEISSADDSGASVKVNDDLAKELDKFVNEKLDKETEKKLTNKNFKDAEKVYYFNPKFYDANGNLIDISNSYIQYSIPLPKGMSEEDNIYLYQLKNGKKIRLKYHINDGMIEFGATGEGPFAIVKYKTEQPEGMDSKSMFKRGLKIALLGLSVIVIAYLIFMIFLRRKNRV